MESPVVDLGPALVVAIVLLALLTVLVASRARLGTAAAAARAPLRAVLQLGAVALILDALVSSFLAGLGFVAVMLLVAGRTAARRITSSRSGWWALAAIVAGVLPVAAGLLAGGVVPADGVAVIAITGIMIGGAMTATALAGRRALDDLAARRGEYEAALALGLSSRVATLEIVRPAAEAALLPSLDQTRTVGLVTLPGAFVGMLLGGATPAEAGAVQLLVLVGVLAAGTVGVAVLTELIATGRIHREPRRRSPAQA